VTIVLALVVALFLPWAAGTLCLVAVGRDTSRDALLAAVAYGQLAGIALLTLFMRVASYIALPWSFAGLASALAAVSVGAAIVLRVRGAGTPATRVAIGAPLGDAWRILAALAALLLVARCASLAYEVVLQPLYPWDAWTQWATKAKVWSALRGMAPFIGYTQWLAGNPGYVDTAPHYPATVPLLQAWIALALGRFDDALVNLPWLAIYVALGVGIYAQLRRLDVAAPLALIVTYMGLSLPLLDTHVALAGYADLPVAATLALGMLALMRWERDRSRVDLVFVAIAIALLPTLKVPGVVWAATLLLGLLIAAFGRSWRRIVLVTLAIAAASAIVVALLFRGKFVSVSGQSQAEIAEPMVANLFLFDNWHLLWYVVPVAIALGWRDALRMRGTSVAFVAGFAFLWATFALTRAGNWVADYTTVNRAILHIAPAALVFAGYLFARWGKRRDDALAANTRAGFAGETASS
jgi:hypothetical protein